MAAPNWSPMQWAAAWAADAGFSRDEIPIAVAIAQAESGCNPKAVHVNSNGTKDWGVWQINDVNNPSDAEKTDGAANAKKAYEVFRAAGNKFTPWTTYKNGAFRKHVAAANSAYVQVVKDMKAGAAGALSNQDAVKNAPISLNPVDGMTNPLTNPVNDAITKPLQDIGNRLFDFFNVSLGVIVGIALLILGVILLGRGFASRVVTGTLKDMAGKAKAAEKAAPKPVKAPLTPEQRARASLDYSAARKRLASEDAKKAADAARERLRKSMGQ